MAGFDPRQVERSSMIAITRSPEARRILLHVFGVAYRCPSAPKRSPLLTSAKADVALAASARVAQADPPPA